MAKKGNKKGSNLLGFFALAVMTGGVLLYMNKMTKEKAIQLLLEDNPARNPTALASFDEGYLIAWAKALGSGNATTYFSYNGKTYKTSDGKAY